MSRPQITRRRPPPATDVTDVPADTREEDAPVDSLQAMLAELGGATSAAITVYRAERGQKQQYVYKCSPDEFSLDVLRDKYNGGNFRLYISKNGVLYKNVEVAVEPRHATSESAPSDAAALAAAMREGFERQSAALAAALRTLAAPVKGDPQVISGESGAVGMGVVSALMTDPAYATLKDALGLCETSRVLLFSTEGDTDPENYRRIVWDGAYASL